jgi:hypothetical protein
MPVTQLGLHCLERSRKDVDRVLEVLAVFLDQKQRAGARLLPDQNELTAVWSELDLNDARRTL